MGTLALRVTGATLRYPLQPRPVLDGLDLEVAHGETFALVGSSGNGKSSLLRVIAGLERLDAGRIEVLDTPDPSSAERRFVGQPGMAFQEPLLLPWLTVTENVSLGRRYRANRRDGLPDVADLLERLDLGPVRDSYPSELSGGQAQRASIARAVAVRPSILLLDEPFGALDPATRGDLRGWLRAVVREWRLTVVIVTHDLAEAIALGDRVGVLGRSGRIDQTWTTADAGPSLASEILACFAHRAPATPAFPVETRSGSRAAWAGGQLAS